MLKQVTIACGLLFFVASLAAIVLCAPKVMEYHFTEHEKHIAAEKDEQERLKRISTNEQLIREGLMDAH